MVNEITKKDKLFHSFRFSHRSFDLPFDVLVICFDFIRFMGHHGKTNDTISTRYSAFDRGYMIGNAFAIGGNDKETASGTFDFHHLRRSDLGKVCTGIAGYETDGERGCLEVQNVYLDLDLVVNNLKILFSSGTVTGKAALYGVKI